MNKIYLIITSYILSTLLPITGNVNGIVRILWVAPIWFIVSWELLFGIQLVYEVFERKCYRFLALTFCTIQFLFVVVYQMVFYKRADGWGWITILIGIQIVKLALIWIILKYIKQTKATKKKLKHHSLVGMTYYTFQYLIGKTKHCDYSIVCTIALFYWIIIGNLVVVSVCYFTNSNWIFLLGGLLYLVVLTLLTRQVYLYQLHSIIQFVLASIGGALVFALSMSSAGVWYLNFFCTICCMSPIILALYKVSEIPSQTE